MNAYVCIHGYLLIAKNIASAHESDGEISTAYVEEIEELSKQF